jgi:hypothetical protein
MIRKQRQNPVIPVACFCVGYVSAFKDSPDLSRAGWRHRLPLAGLVFEDRWGAPDGRMGTALADTGVEEP